MERKETSKFKDEEKNSIILPPTKDEKELMRVEKLLEKAGNSPVGESLKKFQPIIDVAANVLNKVAPFFILGYKYFCIAYSYLPVDIICALIGLCLVFFGGIYVLTVAAAETFYMTGWHGFKTSFLWLKQNFQILWEKSRDDDNKDEDNDGIADVLQLTPKQLVTRKVSFFFIHCSEPQRLMDMVSILCTSVVGVFAVLRVDFAKTIALATTIGEEMRKPAALVIVPIASTALPKEYHQWIAPVINMVCKSVAISIAWFIQRIISSVQTAVRGGLLFSRSILKFFNDKGYIQFNDQETYLDEIIGWSLAVIGVYFQIHDLYSVPFPLNLILWPVDLFENYLTWVIS
jgi:hypothetical protein